MKKHDKTPTKVVFHVLNFVGAEQYDEYFYKEYLILCPHFAPFFSPGKLAFYAYGIFAFGYIGRVQQALPFPSRSSIKGPTRFLKSKTTWPLHVLLMLKDGNLSML